MLKSCRHFAESAQRATSASCYINLTHKRNSFYNRYKHGPTKISNPSPDYVQWVRDFFGPEGKEFIRKEADRIAKKPFRTTFRRKIMPDEMDIIHRFDSDESIAKWKPVADSDSLNGFSKAMFVRSRAGYGLFTGVLDNRLPDDGMTIKSGFAAAIGPSNERDSLFETETFYDWSEYNSFEIKFRGDGRKYAIVLNTGSYSDDIRYYDAHSYPLYTRGGPYWQTARIPFAKFIFNYKGFIQDSQPGLPTTHVKFVAIAISDLVNGPFSFEIAHMGLVNESLPFRETTAYEGYSFSHMRYKPIQVDCDAPES